MNLMLSAKPSAPQTSDTHTAQDAADFAGNALRILHRILIRLRSIAFEGTDPKTIGWMLDDIEYIGVLAMDSRTDAAPEQVAVFRLHLLDLEVKYPAFGQLAAVFDAWQAGREIY